MRKILTTCALPYSNGDIHIGHLVEYLQADIWVRFQRMRGHRCLFFCADDTHGTPIMLAAKKQGIPPEELVKEKKQAHIKDFTDFEVEFTHYSDTHSPHNRELVDRFFRAMEKEHIAYREVEQAFCDSCQMFLPDRFIKGTCPNCESENQYGDSCDQCGSTYNPLDMKNPFCVTCENKPSIKVSEHLFFKLSDFQDFLREWVPGHNSPEVTKKLGEWLGDTLRDWNISRDAPYFGFEIPGHKGKFFYVWVDAPIGYIATSAEWAETQADLSYEDLWGNPEWEIHHFIGKDIIYFHSLFWPAMLKNFGLSTPTRIHAHGFLTIDGQKMSKSKSAFINARAYLQHLNPLYLRYYFFSKISPGLNDIDFSWQDFREKINGVLLAKITNIASRCLQMLHKKSGGRLSVMTPAGLALIEEFRGKQEQLAEWYEKREYAHISVAVRDMAEMVNRYLEERSPWKMEDAGLRDAVLTDGINLFRVLAIYLAPVLPSFAKQVAGFFHEESYRWDSLMVTMENLTTAPYEYLLTRVEEKTIAEFTANS